MVFILDSDFPALYQRVFVANRVIIDAMVATELHHPLDNRILHLRQSRSHPGMDTQKYIALPSARSDNRLCPRLVRTFFLEPIQRPLQQLEGVTMKAATSPKAKKKSRARGKHTVVSSSGWKVQLAAGLWLGLFGLLAMSANGEGELSIWRIIGWGIVALGFLLIIIVCILFAYGLFFADKKRQRQLWRGRDWLHILGAVLFGTSLLFLLAGFLPLFGIDHIPLSSGSSMKTLNIIEPINAIMGALDYVISLLIGFGMLACAIIVCYPDRNEQKQQKRREIEKKSK